MNHRDGRNFWLWSSIFWYLSDWFLVHSIVTIQCRSRSQWWLIWLFHFWHNSIQIKSHFFFGSHTIGNINSTSTRTEMILKIRDLWFSSITKNFSRFVLNSSIKIFIVFFKFTSLIFLWIIIIMPLLTIISITYSY